MPRAIGPSWYGPLAERFARVADELQRSEAETDKNDDQPETEELDDVE